jgi:formylglycine-generating enzyme required for sulfatase activity
MMTMGQSRFSRLTRLAVWTLFSWYGRAVLAGPESPHAVQYEGFAFVQGGAFQMGDLWGDSPWAMPEVPVHEVEVGDFLLAKHEVTVAQFARFVAATGYKTVAELAAGSQANGGFTKDGRTIYPCWREHWFAQGPDHPAVLIAWEDAIVYCNWLSRQHNLSPAYDEKTGHLLDPAGLQTDQIRLVEGFRLPTEAEWEFAARERGRKVRFGNGQDIARANEMNFDAAGTGKMVPSLRMPADHCHPYNEQGTNWGGTSPVGSFRPNSLVLYDMSGNAWEWCSDTGGPDFQAGRQVNPCGQGGTSHLIRGGAHDTDAKACRASARIDWYPKAWCACSGFRVAVTYTLSN